ncbi:MAG: hypothetical protein RLZZ490_1052, partial [Cyanobacteriota bacterium]
SGATTLTANVPNLLVLQVLIDRNAGQNDAVRLWANPSSFADLASGVNFDSLTTGNFIEGTQNLNLFQLNWENSRTQGDLFAIGTSVDDVVSEVPEPLTLLGASAAIAFGAAFKRRKAQ